MTDYSMIDNLGDLGRSFEGLALSTLPEVAMSRIRRLAISQYWDGPLSGLVWVDETIHGFSMAREFSKSSSGRAFALFELIRLPASGLRLRIDVSLVFCYLMEPSAIEFGDPVGWFREYGRIPR